MRSTGSRYIVRADNNLIRECTLKGVFRIQGLKATNPVAVGDIVDFEVPSGKETAVIRKIHPRRNYIIRKSTKLSKTVHIIAANIDQLIIVVTLAFPRTSTGFIDRLLVTAEAYKIPSVIFFNKIDLYDESLYQLQQEFVKIYSDIGYPCFEVSAIQKTNMDLFKKCLRDKVSLIAGHSGVGKSAMINVVEPGLKLKTADISLFSLKGKHTTTFAEMLPLSFGGYIIDTPGIKEFGLVDFYRGELTHYFPEMFALLHQCKYHNCTHTSEPGCAVIAAVDAGQISPDRYGNYLNMFADKEVADTEKGMNIPE